MLYWELNLYVNNIKVNNIDKFCSNWKYMLIFNLTLYLII